MSHYETASTKAGHESIAVCQSGTVSAVPKSARTDPQSRGDQKRTEGD